MLSCVRLQVAHPQVYVLFQRCLALDPGQRPVPFSHPSSHRDPAGSAGILEPHSSSRLPATTLSSGSPGAQERLFLHPVRQPHTPHAGGRNERRARTPASQELWEFVRFPGFSEPWDEGLG